MARDKELREILNDDKIEFLICSICKESFHKKDGKFLVKEKLIICPYCIEESESKDPSKLLLG